MTTQPDQRLNAEEQEIIDALERSCRRPLTQEEIHLSLEQARHLGEITDNVVPIKRGAARSRSLSPSRRWTRLPPPCRWALWSKPDRPCVGRFPAPNIAT